MAGVTGCSLRDRVKLVLDEKVKRMLIGRITVGPQECCNSHVTFVECLQEAVIVVMLARSYSESERIVSRSM